jgi:Peptidase family M28
MPFSFLKCAIPLFLSLWLCCSCGTGGSSPVARESPLASPSPDRVLPAKPDSPVTPNIAPRIDPDRLLTDVEALAFDRSATETRQQARDYIVRELKLAGWTPELLPFEGGINIVAERPGSEPDAGAIVVGAHYDTVPQSPGSDDNATGVATVLEMARVLGAKSTPRSLQLVLFDLEEVGLLGSLIFAANANPDTLKGAIVLDMLGYACHTPGCQKYPEGFPSIALPKTGDFLAAVGDAEHLPLLDSISAQRGDDGPLVVALPVPIKGVLTPTLLRSDHASFWLQGIGAVMLTDTANFRNPNYHQSTDLPETLDREFFSKSAQLVVNATDRLLSSRESLVTEKNEQSSDNQ